MIAVIFEVWPTEGRAQEYFDLAAALKVDLEKIDGFLWIERFESLATKGKYLSLSFWRHEEAVRVWRYCQLELGAARLSAGRPVVLATTDTGFRPKSLAMPSGFIIVSV